MSLLLFETFPTAVIQKKIYYWLRYVYMWIGKHMWLVIWTVLSILKDISRSQAVTYTVKVVISWKQCKMETYSPLIASDVWLVK